MKSLSEWHHGTQAEKRLLERCRNIVVAIKPGAEVILYGSHARGDMESGSDIDILVILHGDVHPMDEIRRTGGIVSRISLKYNEVISCLFMEEERYLHRNGPLLRNIRKEGIPL